MQDFLVATNVWQNQPAYAMKHLRSMPLVNLLLASNCLFAVPARPPVMGLSSQHGSIAGRVLGGIFYVANAVTLLKPTRKTAGELFFIQFNS